ncbi:MAG: hypothetical protein M1832_004074 [Thelocarpon impressellum]|nr:MAG: hypothetical protein M1832_004074 [Thelocarpon impressellum]
MFLQSRRMPELSIRRPDAASSSGNYPASPALSKSMFHRLAETPPPSPGLPSMRPRHGRRGAPWRHRGCLRLLAWLCGVAVITFFVLSVLVGGRRPERAGPPAREHVYEALGDGRLPEKPAPLVVTDKRGRARWTVSIPPGLSFPLRPAEYRDVCKRAVDVAAHVSQMKSHDAGSGHHGARFGYYHDDKNFMDVQEAEEHGILPGVAEPERPSGVKKMWNAVLGKDELDLMGEDQDALAAGAGAAVCAKSLTYVLETADAGFGSTLMGMWLSYGLAKREGRAFFVDDANWAYGKYTTYLAPIPRPACRPPPRTQIVPCPHQARHLLVSAATTSWTFGHAFNEEYEDPRGMEVMRQRNIFAMMQDGHDALFRLAPGDDEYVEARIGELDAAAAAATAEAGRKGMTVGVHVRHGDLHPMEFQYQHSYIPLERYTAAARELVRSSAPATEVLDDFEARSTLVLASDDPDVYAADELANATRAQERILLASKAELDAAGKDQGRAGPRIGWEGGFFGALFWSLGANKASFSHRSLGKPTPPSERTLRLRELVGRTYVLDLKVLGHGADGIVCGVSSIGCRLLAVMLGWETAIEDGKWRNVDGDFEWKGIVW